MSDIKTERIRKQEERRQKFKSLLGKLKEAIDEEKLPSEFQTEMEDSCNRTIEKFEKELNASLKREDMLSEWEEIKKRMRFAHIKVSPLMDYSTAERLVTVSTKQAKQLGAKYLGECAAIIAIDRYVDIGKIKPKTVPKSHASVYVREEFVKNLVDGLKERFEDGKEKDLRQLLTGKELSAPLLFNGFGSTLVHTLKTAYESKWFFCPNKSDFMNWICRSFQYVSSGKKPRSITKGQVSKIVYSRKGSIPKSRRIEIDGLVYSKNKR